MEKRIKSYKLFVNSVNGKTIFIIHKWIEFQFYQIAMTNNIYKNYVTNSMKRIITKKLEIQSKLLKYFYTQEIAV